MASSGGLAGKRGAIAQVRRYPDGRYRYTIGSREDGVGGLYDEEDLAPTGERESIELFQLPGRFRPRDLVRVAADYGDEQVAGREGVIDGSYAEGDRGLLLGVWVEELRQSFVVPSDFLTGTGNRARRPSGQTVTSIRVSEGGEILARDSYEIVDDVEYQL